MDKFKLEFNTKKPKYIQIYVKIKNMIENKELKSNEKLPTIRKFAKILKVNNSTVVKAYELLEKENFVFKIVGSGTYINEKKKKIKEDIKNSKNDIIPFHIGNPSSDIFPINDFKKAIDIALKEDGASVFEYDDGLGFYELRLELKEYLKSKNINTSEDKIQIISGAQQGIDIVCKTLVDYGDIIFTEEPTYNGAIDIFSNKGAKIIQIPMLNDGIDIGVLKLKLEKIKPKLIYIMSNYQNPTGISYSKYKKKKLIELANEYDFYILEDDFLSDFKFYSKNNTTIRAYDNSSRVIYVKSFSKILMPGLRIGLLDMPYNLKDKLCEAKYYTDISTSSLIQRALYYYIKDFDWKKNLYVVETIYRKRFDKMKNIIENKFDKRLQYYISCGGINFFLKLPKGYSSTDFKRFLLKRGVGILEGEIFFENPIENRFFRLNIASTSLEQIEIGMDIIKKSLDDFLDEYKYNNDFKNEKFLY